MSKADKLITRLLTLPKDFTWDELTVVLKYFGYSELSTGKTGGSRRKFLDEQKSVISLHKPHPGNIVKKYALEIVITALKEKGKL